MITVRLLPFLLAPLYFSAPVLAQFTPPPSTQPLNTGAGGIRVTGDEQNPGQNGIEMFFNAPDESRTIIPTPLQVIPAQTRGDGCSPIDTETELPILALTSASGGYSVTDRPSFAIFMPATSADSASLEIYTQDLNEMVVQLDIKLPPTPGILYIKLPEEIAETAKLKAGESYWWAFTPQCAGSFQTLTVTPAWTAADPSNPYPSAWIARVAEESEAANPPDNLAPLDLAIWYAERGVWFDAVDLLIAALHDSSAEADRDRAQRLWSQLIEPQLTQLQAEYAIESSQDLRQIVDAPIIEIPAADITVIFPFTDAPP
jgi:Domain of Unknown Function (DUF928)